LSATAIKRIRRSPQTGLNETLEESLSKIDKKYWLIRQPEGQHQWTFLIGSRGFQWQEWRKEKSYRLDSEIGQEIMFKLNLTEQEFKDHIQPRLF